MWTANYFTKGIQPNGVAISLGKPKTWRGREYPPLYPRGWMLKLHGQEFTTAYLDVVLGNLDARKAVEELGEDSVLLCWEPYNVFCHRRLVAEWIERETGMIVPEYGHRREESLPAAEMPGKAEAKRKKLAAGELF